MEGHLAQDQERGCSGHNIQVAGGGVWSGQAAIGWELHIGHLAQRLGQARRALGRGFDFQHAGQVERGNAHLAFAAGGEPHQRVTGRVVDGDCGGGLGVD